MKRIGNLYDQIISIDNLRLADEKARRGKTHSWGVKIHDKHREENLLRLHEDLKNHTFRTSEYETFKIYEPKERIIFRLPYFPDRIVHHAVMNIMEPIWVAIFTHDTYSCIKDRGIHQAAEKVRKALDQDPSGTTFCLKIDIRHFYPSIDHKILKNIVRRKVKDPDLLWLLDEIIDSAEGVPIGNYLSQYFANLYMCYFDHWIKEVKDVKYYFRYADDIVILGNDKKELQRLLIEIRDYLRKKLKLKVKKNFQVFPVDARGIDFLGFVFFHSHTLIRKSIKQNLCRRVAKIRKKMKVKHVSFAKCRQDVASWWGWLKYSDSKHLSQTIFNKLHYEFNFRR